MTTCLSQGGKKTLAEKKVVRDGSASVFQGRVIVVEPRGGGRQAVLEPGPGLKLYVNEAEITEPREVTSSDKIRVELMSEPGQISVQVVLSSDGLKAKAGLDLVPGSQYRLVDSGPRQHLVLTTKAEPQLPPVKPELVEQALQEKGVFVGIDKKAIESLAVAGPGVSKVVARGKPPVPGQDARIELKFKDQQQRLPNAEQLRVDWRELRVIPTVETGDELAVKHPPILGEPGLSVTGEPIAPRVPVDIELLAGEGAEIVNGGLRAVATRSGRPAYVRGKLEVFPLLVAERGVNLASGNIKFNGDVVVRGNVDETMAVYAGGNIEVTGNSTHANLTAGGQVVVRQNVIGGIVRAGGVGAVHLRVQESWEKLAAGLEDCAAALTQISEHPELGPAASRRGWGRVMSRLLDTKFSYLPGLINDLAGAYREVSGIITAEIDDVLSALRETTSRRGVLQVTGAGEVWGLVKQVRKLVDSLQNSSGERLLFSASYVQGARVEASGDILVGGKGCYQSFLYAGHCVRVDGQPGIVRGGVVQAPERIVVNEAGSGGGSSTLLKVNAGGTVVAKKVYPNVTIQVGQVRHLFQESDQGIVARIDQEGTLVLY